MTHQQNQSQKPLASQEIQELEEEHLEEVAGGGLSCFGCFSRKSSTTTTTDHPQSIVIWSESTRDAYSLMARGTGIPHGQYEQYKQKQQQENETAASFKELPFHPK